MEEYNKEDLEQTLLARWLSGNLSKEEEESLLSSGENKIIEKIIGTVDQWSLPELNGNYYQSLQEKLQEKQTTKVIPLYKNKTLLSIAASLLLIISVSVTYLLFFNSKEVIYQCNAGQKLDVYLPDQTHVTLNGHSSLSFMDKDWSMQREVKLDGEAYFEVTKKGPFKVRFAKGNVDVLGTRFTIMSGKDLATVKCYEGKVAVSVKNALSSILTEGMAVRIFEGDSIDSFKVETKEPDWKNGENSFKEAPLLEVINSLSIQFNTQFEIGNSIDLNRKYTGKFIHSDLDAALKMVFVPMGIEYSVEGSKRKIVTLK